MLARANSKKRRDSETARAPTEPSDVVALVGFV